MKTLYQNWPSLSDHNSNILTAAKSQITSIINSYTYNDFITKRLQIQSNMGYSIGTILKTSYYSQLTTFVMAQVILADTHENTYVNNLVTSQQSLTQANINAQNIIVAEISTVSATSASAVATTNNDAVVAATTAYYTKKAEGDAAFWSAASVGLNTLKTTLGSEFAATSATTTANLLAFLYSDKLIDVTSKIDWNLDILAVDV